jgi:hypothetical protein
MIIQELRAEFNEYFQSIDPELILWLDHSGQWKGIIEHLRKDFELIEYRGSQLEIKAKVELTWAKGKRPKFILYLPGLTRDNLTVLKEYEFSGKVFEETILQCFRRWGIEFEREHESELGKIFPVLVTRFATKNRSFWQKQLTPENVRSLLFDDESVRKMLANPETTVKELKDNGTFEIFCDFIEDRFGGPKLRENNPTEWTLQFTAYLILTEVRIGAGRPASFPKFDIKWADDRHEGECLSFIRDWFRHSTYKEDYKRLSNEVEKRYDLSLWATGLSEYPGCESSLSVEKILEKNILTKINNIKSLIDLRSIISAEIMNIEKMAEHFWSQEGDIVAWKALLLSHQIVREIDHGSAEVEKIDSPSILVQRYSGDWWEIDRSYRAFRAKYDGEDRITRLSLLITNLYREFQDRLNDKFLKELEIQKSLPIEGIKKQNSFWIENVRPSRKKRAVFLVDALRFELACDLKERLEKSVKDAQIKCFPLVTSVPTLTSIGMASIISGDEIEISAPIEGDWMIRSVKKGETGSLNSVEDRKAILGKRHSKAIFFTLEELLKPSELNIGERNPVIVFTREMDGLGHDSGVLNLSLDYFGQYLEGLIRAIRRLGSMGIEEIHLVSDHGFVILDDIGEADKVSIPKELELFYKGHRCLVGQGLPQELGVVFELPNSEGLQFCVPRGIGIFRTRGGKQFFHGGLSLQEFIVPHMHIIFTKVQPKYGAKLRAPEAIRNLIFDVELLRAIPAEGVLFGAPRFVEIVGVLLKERREIFRQSGPDMVVNQESESLKVRLRIKPGTTFSYGDMLSLELKDADTGELLDSSEIRIEVE